MVFRGNQHNRIYPFRPARREHDAEAGRGSLYFRFLKAYVWPFRWSVGLITLLVCLESCSVFLLSYYTRVVVDTILVVEPPKRDTTKPVSMHGEARPKDAELKPTHGRSLPKDSMGARIDRGLIGARRPPDAGQRLLVMFIAYVGTLITLNVVSRLASRTRIRVGQRITANLRDDMHEKVIQLSLAYHSSHNPGRLLSRILWDVGAVQDQMLTTIINKTSCVLMVVFGFGILLSISWKLALLAACVLPLYVLVYQRGRPPLRDNSFEASHTNSCLYGLVSQKLDSIRAVQAYGRERQERLNFHRLAAVYLRDSLTQARLSATLGRMGEVLSALGTNGAVFLVGAYMVLEGKLTLGQMLYAHGIAASLFGPVLQLSSINILMTNLLVSLRRLADVLDEPIEIRDKPGAVDFPAPVNTGIVIRNVYFRYSPETDPIFRNVSLTVPAGQWLCVMGASGSGKTTLLHLLARLYEPTSGEILVDGIPMGKVKIDSLRQHLSLVPQEARIFSGTVRDNIVYGHPDASPNQIMAAAKAAELHNFVMTLKVQYETLLGEKGTTLSGGQKQRISLARALLTSPEVLLLDDCTSALDAETERRIQDTLSNILVGKTAVIVSQRVSMAQRCHRIAVLADGLVSEYGTHAELLAGNGFFARLHAQQTE